MGQEAKHLAKLPNRARKTKRQKTKKAILLPRKRAQEVHQAVMTNLLPWSRAQDRRKLQITALQMAVYRTTGQTGGERQRPQTQRQQNFPGGVGSASEQSKQKMLQTLPLGEISRQLHQQQVWWTQKVPLSLLQSLNLKVRLQESYAAFATTLCAGELGLSGSTSSHPASASVLVDRFPPRGSLVPGVEKCLPPKTPGQGNSIHCIAVAAADRNHSLPPLGPAAQTTIQDGRIGKTTKHGRPLGPALTTRLGATTAWKGGMMQPGMVANGHGQAGMLLPLSSGAESPEKSNMVCGKQILIPRGAAQRLPQNSGAESPEKSNMVCGKEILLPLKSGAAQRLPQNSGAESPEKSNMVGGNVLLPLKSGAAQRLRTVGLVGSGETMILTGPAGADSST